MYALKAISEDTKDEEVTKLIASKNALMDGMGVY
jgi:hypothetical protein